MAKNLIEDENVTKSKCYSPAVCQSLSIGIVNDSDYNMIKSFASEDTEKNFLHGQTLDDDSIDSNEQNSYINQPSTDL